MDELTSRRSSCRFPPGTQRATKRWRDGGVNLCGFGYTLILIVIAKQQGATPFETGLVLGAGGGAAAVGSVVFARLARLIGRGRLLVVSTWVLALTWLAYALAPNPACRSARKRTSGSCQIHVRPSSTSRCSEVVLAPDDTDRDS
jgi:predicted MFS family arabinose efflux permease